MLVTQYMAALSLEEREYAVKCLPKAALKKCKEACKFEAEDPRRQRCCTEAIDITVNESVTPSGEQFHSRFRIGTRTLQGLAGAAIAAGIGAALVASKNAGKGK